MFQTNSSSTAIAVPLLPQEKAFVKCVYERREKERFANIKNSPKWTVFLLLKLFYKVVEEGYVEAFDVAGVALLCDLGVDG